MKPRGEAVRGFGPAGFMVVGFVLVVALATMPLVSALAQDELRDAGDTAAVASEADPVPRPAVTVAPEDPATLPATASESAGRFGTREPRPLASPVAPVVGARVDHRAVFDIGAPMALASFVRDDALWLVFSADAPLDGPLLARQGELGLGTALIAEARGGVALRFDNEGGRRPLIDRDGTEWAVMLPAAEPALPPSLDILVQPDHPDGPRLFIAAAGATRPVAFIDPAVGDILVAMPLTVAGHGIDAAHRFAEFQLLPSIVGIVLRPSIDDLRVRTVEDGVAITSESGLQLS